MSTNTKRVSILRYWTSRYFIALVIGLVIIAFVSALWIRHSAIENRLDLMTYIAEDTAERIISQQTGTPPDTALGRPEQPLRDMRAITYILNAERTIISSNQPPMTKLVNLASLSKTKEVQQFTDDTSYYAVQKPLTYEGETVGYVVVIDTKENITKVEQKYGQLAFAIIALAIFGWCVIYFLSKRLSKPINEVSKAAFEIQHGNYNVSLPNEIKEQEVYELVSSFKEMAQKLEQLELTRTELLAGVTHELKTPVTSISGLLQAVKDGVVNEDEASDFINMALIETTKMKTLVGDLLAFNSYSVDAVPLNLTTASINKIVSSNIQLWQTIRENEKVKIDLVLLEKDERVEIDEVRIQQIFTNLLNNAIQSMNEVPFISIKINKINDYLTITITDQGTGIPREEQPFIFERFYRGENKKYLTRGLGLGLPLSKMMAKSLSGDLQLIRSDVNGSTFELSLPIKKI